MKWVIRFVSLSVLGALVSCNLAPPYHRPDLDVPCGWRMESDESSTCANIRWWEDLGDPVLDALVIQALQNNKDLKTAIWRVCEFFAKYKIARSELFPQIEAEGFALKEKLPQSSFFPSGFDPYTGAYQFEFTLSYEIDFWGRIRNLSKAAYEELLAEIENRRTVVLTLVSSVAEAYVRIRELDRELEVAKATLLDREEYTLLAWKRFKGGLTSEIEYEQAVSLMEETRAAVVALETKIPIIENLLSVLLGETPTCIVRGKTLDELTVSPEVPAGLPSDLLEQRPDIIAMERNLIAANARIGVARAAFFPKISLTGYYGAESFQLRNFLKMSSRMWAIGGELAQAIFTGGRLTGQLGEAIAIRQELLYQYEQTILNAFKEVNDALVAHYQSKELVLVEKKRVKADTEYLRLAWLRYYNGQNDYLTVLDAQRQLFRSEIDLAKAQGDVLLTLVDLYKSLGGGWVWDADCLSQYMESADSIN